MINKSWEHKTISTLPKPPTDSQLAKILGEAHYRENYVQSFESEIAKLVGVSHGVLTTSITSALILVLSALFSKSLQSKQLQSGDEIIVPATINIELINVLLGFGLIPVIVDINIGNYNPAPYYIDRAVTEKTKAIYISHFFGNPCEIEEILEIAQVRNLWVIEDCHGALGAELGGKRIGSFGSVAISTLSDFGNISTQEGGIILTKSAMIHQLITTESRSPDRYRYSIHDFLPTRYQAIIGKNQLSIWEELRADRVANWEYIREGFKVSGMDRFFILPTQLKSSSPTWAGVLLTLRESSSKTRETLISQLREHQIEACLPLFFQFDAQEYSDGAEWRIEADVPTLPHAKIMKDRTLWIGCHPQMTKNDLDYIVYTIKNIMEDTNDR